MNDDPSERPEHERTDRPPNPRVVAIEEALGTLAQWLPGYSEVWADGQQRRTVVTAIDDERIVLTYRRGPLFAAEDDDPVISLRITATHENALKKTARPIRQPAPAFGGSTGAHEDRGFPASYESLCSECGSTIDQGDRISRNDDDAYVHVECLS